MKLVRYVVVFFFAGCLGCGGDYFDAYIKSGESIHVGEEKRVSTSTPLRSTTCFSPTSSETVDCIARSQIFVGLPLELGYAGDPEAVYDFGDLIFGETNLDEPAIVVCEQGTLLRFSVPEEDIDIDPDGDGIIEDIGDDIIDSFSREFRFNIKGNAASSSAAIRIATVLDGDSVSCAELFAKSPERIVRVLD